MSLVRAEASDTGTTVAPIACNNYPSITVPAGLVQTIPASPSSAPFPAGFVAKPGSYNVTFTGKAWSEPRLIALAYAYEQASLKRVVPFSAPALNKDVKGNAKAGK